MNYFIRQIAGPKLQAVVRQDCEQLARKHTFGSMEYVKGKDFHMLAEYPLMPGECTPPILKLWTPTWLENYMRIHRELTERMWQELFFPRKREGGIQVQRANQPYNGPLHPLTED